MAIVQSVASCSFSNTLPMNSDGLLDWRMIQSLVRLMPDLHKTLLLASLHPGEDGTYSVQELAMASEHAPFRHKHLERTRKATQVGEQRKKQKRPAQEKPADPDNDDKAAT